MEFHESRNDMDFHASVSPLTDATGKLVGSLHIARDITERKRRDRRLAYLNTMREDILRTPDFAEKMSAIRTCMESLFPKSILRVWITDLPNNHHDTSEMAGERESEAPKIIGNRAFTLVAASGGPLPLPSTGRWDAFECDCLHQLVTGDVSPLVFDDHCLEGIPAHHRVAGSRILSNTGTAIGVFFYIGEDPLVPPTSNLLATVFSAMTYVLGAEISAHTLRQSEKRYRELFESLMDVYVRTNTMGIVTMVSPSVEAVMGFRPEEILGTPTIDYWVNPELREPFLRDVREYETLFNREVLLKKKDGAIFWASYNAKLLRDSRGQEAGIEVMFRDVTEKKQMEALMRIQRDLSVALIHADDLKSALTVCLEAALKVQEVDAGGIYLESAEKDGFDLMVHRNLPPELVTAVAHLDKDSPQVELVSRGQSIFETYNTVIDGFGSVLGGRNLHHRAGLRAFTAIPISHAGGIIGCLNASSTTADTFSPISRSHIEAIAGQMAAALGKIKIDQELKTSQRNLETLLKEIHHRVKNNLAVVASMLNLQIKHSKNSVVRESLKESRARVRSMALIHETLYQNEDLSAVNLKEYARKLMRDLLSVYENISEQVVIDYDIDDLQLELNQAVYCGMIVNELVTNALKYAFVGRRKGNLCISARRVADNETRLSVKDNGVGLPPTFDWKNASTLGLRLISLMAEQLRGSLALNSKHGHGLEAIIQWNGNLREESQERRS
ncbi:PAS domain-containing sensor histidine kinase [Desulfosarcina cetonica]|uniref:PAS domain-containing sensor histidine kinase n=1 Tax=Desulfosarcina cetonica TaxID=90730 RepID=UPI00155D9F6F|nr:histidine kinase dimerization/phosphoacceptor domain -containing protein [Desulfosarcina cetonica]